MNCGHCAKGFSSGRILREHEKICFASNGQAAFFSDTKFYCTLCDDLFYVRLAFVWHLQSHLKSKISRLDKEDITTRLYNLGISRGDKINKSLKILNSRKLALRECKPCQIEFAGIKAANLHHKLCHSAEQSSYNHIVSVFECDACNRSFDNLNLLENHSCVSHSTQRIREQNIDIPDVFSPVQVVIPRDKTKGDAIGQINFDRSDIYSRYLCLLCNMTVLTPRMAHYHLLRHKPDHCVPFVTNVCPVCREDMSSRKKLSVHLHSLHSYYPKVGRTKRSSDFICEICGSVLKSFTFYENHMVRVHNFIEEKSCRSARCKDCNKRFRDRRGLKLHLNYKKCQLPWKKVEAAAVVASPMICIYCGSGFPNGLTLGKHVKKKHRLFIKGKKYSCCETDCKKLFSGYGNLARHHRSAHSSPANECSVCHKIFDEAKDFLLHSLKHKLPKFHCPLCAKMISGPTSCLRAHLNSFHFQRLRYYRKVVAKAAKRMLLRGRHLPPKDLDATSPGVRCSRCLQDFKNEDCLWRHSLKEHSCVFSAVTTAETSNILPLNISFLSPKSADIVESLPDRNILSNGTDQHNLADNRSNCVASEPSPLDSMSLFGTIKLGGVDLPVYQLTPGQFEQLQLDDTGSLVGTSFTISQ